MRLILYLALVILAVGQDATRLFFIRHAETVSGSNDPQLSKEGLLRAEKWIQVLRKEKIDAIYSTDYKRTKETATIIAKQFNLEIRLYEMNGFSVSKFIKENETKTIVIVGHSNTTPILVNSFLGIYKYGQLDHNNYGTLYVVNFFSSQQVSASCFVID